MAYIVNSSIAENTTATSVVVPLPVGIEDDDQILIIMSQDNGGATISTSDGYSEVTGTTQTSVSGNRSAAFLKKASTPESDPTFTGNNDQWAVVCIVVRDADPTTAIDIASQSDFSSATSSPTCPDVTTTAAGELVIRALGGADNGTIESMLPVDAPAAYVNRHVNTVRAVVAQASQVTAGATGTFAWDCSATETWTAYTIAFKNKSGSANSIAYESGLTEVHRYGRVGDLKSTLTYTGLDSSITTLNGVTVSTASLTVTHTSAFSNQSYGSHDRFAIGVAGPIYFGVTHPISSTDFSGQVVGVTMGPQRFGETGDDGVVVILFSSTNWAAFNIPASELIINDNGRTLFFDENTTPLDTNGTLNWSAVDKIGYAWHKSGTGTASRWFGWRELVLINTCKFTGGNSLRPVTPARMLDFLSHDTSLEYSSLQGLGQALFKHPITIGDGTSDVYFQSSTQSIEYPPSTDLKYKVSANQIDYTLDLTAGSTVDFTASILRADTEQDFVIDSGSSTSATHSFSGFSIIGWSATWLTGVDPTSITFIQSGIIDMQAATFTSCVFKASESTTHSVTIDPGGDLISCAFTKGDETYAIEIPTAGSYDFTDTTWTDYTTDLNVTAATGTVTITLASGQTQPTYTSAGATVAFIQPTVTFTINSSESSSLIQIFTTSTQTILASTTGSSLAYDHSSETVDYVVQKAGFLPQRVTGKVLSGSSSLTINLVSDPVYLSGHGLTYTTDLSYDRTTSELTLNTRSSGRNHYSALIDAFISESALRNTAFKFRPNGPASIFFLDDSELIDASSEDNWNSTGIRYLDSSEVVTSEWAHVISVGTATGFTGEYQQVDGSGTTDARATGVFDQIIQVYGDATHGNFDYRDHLVLKFQPNGYRESRSNIIDLFGISTIEPISYTVAMEPVAIVAAVGDPAITITITDHGATPVTWNSKDFSVTITDSAGGNSGEDILRELNYNLSLDATYQSKDPFNWPAMVKELGSAYDTLRGYTEGAQSSTLKGVRVVQNDGTTPHADFTRFQADDGTYYTPPTVAQVSAPNVTDGRIQIYNATGAAASSWAATTAYSLGDYVLRTTGKGTELGDGVFFACTTAGTSSGSEPTWDVAANGNTTNDGTVVWTVRPVEFDNAVTTSGYTNSWTDEEEFAAGDTIRLRWVDEDDLEILATGVATTDGTTSFLDAPVDDTVYDAYGIDGSTVTEYAADFPNVEVDVTDPDNIFYIDRFYAWWKYNLTTEDGIRNFFSGVSATNASNILINDSVIDVKFDNTKAVSARQGDNIVIQRDDGVYPQVTTTSGGGGLGFYFTGVGYTAETGVTGLTAGESAKLDAISSVDANVDEVKVRLDLDATKPNTYADDNSSITNDDFTLTKSDNGNGTFDIVKT